MQESADLFNDTAVALAADGCYMEAIAYLRRALQLEPDNALLWFNLGLNYYALKQKQNSRNALLNAAECNPYDADIWDTLGVVLHEVGETEASKKAYTTALNLEATNGRIWNNYGTLLFNVQEYRQARHAFESALLFSPDLTDALFNLRDTYSILGNTVLEKKCEKMIQSILPKEKRPIKGSR